MAVCDYCNKNFNFFGVHEGDYSFCSANCKNQARALLKSLEQFTPQQIEDYIGRSRAGPCRQCGKPNPVDLYQSYRVISMILLTRWTTHNHFVCRECARREQLKSLAYSAALGWWGFPFGLVLTPVQIIRNIVAMSGGADPKQASPRLRSLLKLNLARQVAAAAAAPVAAPSKQ
jgi:hypothetical protein